MVQRAPRLAELGPLRHVERVLVGRRTAAAARYCGRSPLRLCIITSRRSRCGSAGSAGTRSSLADAVLHGVERAEPAVRFAIVGRRSATSAFQTSRPSRSRGRGSTDRPADARRRHRPGARRRMAPGRRSRPCVSPAATLARAASSTAGSSGCACLRHRPAASAPRKRRPGLDHDEGGSERRGRARHAWATLLRRNGCAEYTGDAAASACAQRPRSAAPTVRPFSRSGPARGRRSKPRLWPPRRRTVRSGARASRPTRWARSTSPPTSTTARSRRAR